MRKALLILFAAAAVSAAGLSAEAAPSKQQPARGAEASPAGPDTSSPGATVEAGRGLINVFESDPSSGPLWKAFEAAEPDMVMALARSLLDHQAQGAGPDALKAEVTRGTAAIFRQAMRDMWRAPEADLVAYAHAMTDFYRVVQKRDPALCGRLAGGAMTQADMTVMSAADIAAADGRLTMAVLRAAAAARRDPTSRGAPTEADLLEMRNGLAAHGAPADIAADPSKFKDAPGEQQCAATIALIDSAASLTDGAAGRLIASLADQIAGSTTSGG